jgi:hypothetical protein
VRHINDATCDKLCTFPTYPLPCRPFSSSCMFTGCYSFGRHHPCALAPLLPDQTAAARSVLALTNPRASQTFRSLVLVDSNHYNVAVDCHCYRQSSNSSYLLLHKVSQGVMVPICLKKKIQSKELPCRQRDAQGRIVLPCLSILTQQ